jgi:hypothetical protein
LLRQDKAEQAVHLEVQVITALLELLALCYLLIPPFCFKLTEVVVVLHLEVREELHQAQLDLHCLAYLVALQVKQVAMQIQQLQHQQQLL